MVDWFWWRLNPIIIIPSRTLKYFVLLIYKKKSHKWEKQPMTIKFANLWQPVLKITYIKKPHKDNSLKGTVTNWKTIINDCLLV